MKSDKLKLTALLLATALPISLATWMFNQREGQGVMATTNKGELIIPPIDLPELALRDAQDQPLFRPFEEEVAGVDPQDYVPRPWLLVYLGGPLCEAQCEERLYYLRQLHRRLGAEAPRVLRYYAYVGAPGTGLDDSTAALLAREHPGMEQARAEPEALRAALARSHPAEVDPVTEHYIYVVDPVGNVMLYFTPENTPEEILSDLENLLDRSSLG